MNKKKSNEKNAGINRLVTDHKILPKSHEKLLLLDNNVQISKNDKNKPFEENAILYTCNS